MNKVIIMSLGVLLATGAVSALAGKEDRQQLTACKADIVALYGDGTRSRLRSIMRDEEGTAMRIMVRPASGNNELVVCTSMGDGLNSLTDRDGVALAAPGNAEETVSLAE